VSPLISARDVLVLGDGDRALMAAHVRRSGCRVTSKVAVTAAKTTCCLLYLRLVIQILYVYRIRFAGFVLLITFRVSRRRREMYIGHARLCVYVSRRIPTLLYGSGCNLGNGKGAS